MPIRLSKEEIVTLRVLAEKGQNHCAIAKTLGVTEGTVRYHLRRAAAGADAGSANVEAEDLGGPRLRGRAGHV